MAPVPVYINARFLTQAVTGVQRYAHELARALDALAGSGEIDGSLYRLSLLAPREGLLRDPGLKHIPLVKAGALKGHAWEQFELPRHARGGLLFCPGNTAPVASLLLKRPTVVTVHSLSYVYFPGAYGLPFRAFYHLVVPLVLSRADAVITVSEAEKASIVKLYPRASGRLTAIQSGAGITAGCAAPGQQPAAGRKPYALFVGSVSRNKNLQGFLEAMAVVNKWRALDAVVVGSTARSFRALRPGVPPGMEGKVSFMGQVDDGERLSALYRGALCLVFPSFYESSGLPPVEAMACGCPVVASSDPALRERLGDAALYCDPRDPEDIARQVELLMKDPALHEGLRQRGLERAGLFTWEKCARETFGVLKKVADARVRAGA